MKIVFRFYFGGLFFLEYHQYSRSRTSLGTPLSKSMPPAKLGLSRPPSFPICKHSALNVAYLYRVSFFIVHGVAPPRLLKNGAAWSYSRAYHLLAASHVVLAVCNRWRLAFTLFKISASSWTRSLSGLQPRPGLVSSSAPSPLRYHCNQFFTLISTSSRCPLPLRTYDPLL